MLNEDIIKTLKEDITEIKQKGFNDYKIIEGLNINGYFEVDLMVSLSGGEGLGYCFNKSIRTIRFKSLEGRKRFLNLIKGVSL